CKATEDDEVMLTTNSGMVIRTALKQTRTIGRNTQGVRLIKLDDGDAVSSLAKLPEDEIGESLGLATVNGDQQPANDGEGSSASGHTVQDGEPSDDEESPESFGDGERGESDSDRAGDSNGDDSEEGD